jgi:hypothetical protein
MQCTAQCDLPLIVQHCHTLTPPARKQGNCVSATQRSAHRPCFSATWSHSAQRPLGAQMRRLLTSHANAQRMVPLCGAAVGDTLPTCSITQVRQLRAVAAIGCAAAAAAAGGGGGKCGAHPQTTITLSQNGSTGARYRLYPQPPTAYWRVPGGLGQAALPGRVPAETPGHPPDGATDPQWQVVVRTLRSTEDPFDCSKALIAPHSQAGPGFCSKHYLVSIDALANPEPKKHVPVHRGQCHTCCLPCRQV